jgi:hypothetical protein
MMDRNGYILNTIQLSSENKLYILLNYEANQIVGLNLSNNEIYIKKNSNHLIKRKVLFL